MGSSSYNYIKLEHFVPFAEEEFESGKLKLITRYKSDVKFSLKNSNVTKIKIPKNLVNLDPGCFSGCQHLQSIEVDTQNPNLRMEDTILVDIVNNRPIAILGGELPEGITRIDSGLITGNAESITIPASVTYIAPDAFVGFKGNITVDEDNETYWSHGNIIFLKADDSIWTFGYNVTWPSTLTTIPAYAFRNYINYNNKTYIRPYIESAIIENGVTNIGNYAFSGCKNLTSVTIPNSIISIGYDAFSINNDEDYDGLITNITSIESWCNITFNGGTSNPLMRGSLYLNGLKITNLVIPNTVTKINAYAFYSCSLLTNITISNSVEEIENAAFGSCVNLTSINIGSGLAIIDNYAFIDCSNVQTVTVSNENTAFYTGVNGLVRKSDNKVIISGLNFTTPNDPNFTQIGYAELLPNPVKPNLTLSPSVKRIYGNNTYSSLSNKIQSITLNNTLEEIGNYAFATGNDTEGKYLIENITIPNTVTAIGLYAFYYQTNLTSIIIPDSVTSIGQSAFYGSGLTSVTLSNNITTIALYTFEYSKLTSITIPDGVTTIGLEAFRSCRDLISLNIPASVTDIGYQSFYDCRNLETITVDSNNTVYDSRNNCNAIIETATNKVILGCKNTVLPNTVTEIGERAFVNLDLTNVIIPNSVTKISNDSFYNCTGGLLVDDILYAGSILLKVNNNTKSSYTIREGTTIINSSAFYYCTSATSITIPNSVIRILTSAFNSCYNLTSITIPENVETIGNYAFSGCSKLDTVVINSNKIKRLEDYVFRSTKISTINIPDSIEYISNTAFLSVTTLPVVNYIRYADTAALNVTNTSQTSYTVREGTKILCNSLFSGCLSATSISIPEGITLIGDSAFYNCRKLTTLNLPQNLRYLGSNAFMYCYELSNPIVIPNQVSIIPTYAFYNCEKIPSITIGNNVTRIDSYAFNGCSGVSEVNIDSLEHWLNIDFTGSSTSPFISTTNSTLFKINGTEVTNLVIPNNITKIKDYSLSYIGEGSTVNSITVPSSVKQIGAYAFNKCYNVDIDITNLEQISNHAFSYTTFTNTDITINNSVELIGTYQFTNSNITTLDYRLNTIPMGLCAYCSSLTSVNLSNSMLSEIPDSVFAECSNLTSITIPNSVTSIKGYAFYKSGLTSITIPLNVESIGNYAFGYTNITSLIIPESVTSIGESAFRNCTQLTSVIINNNISFSLNYIFSGCSNLTDVTINSEDTLTLSTADPFTAASIIKVPCNLYPIALQGVFKNKVQPITDECLLYRWVDVREICQNNELHMLQKKQISSNGTDWYDTSETQVLSEVLGECESTTPLADGLVVWLDGKTLTSGDTEWWCNDLEVNVLRSNWGVRFRSTNTSVGTNCMVVSGNNGGASILTDSGYDNFLVENPNPMYYDTHTPSVDDPITYEIAFKLNSNYSMPNSYMYLFGSSYTINGSADRWNLRINSSGNPYLYNLRRNVNAIGPVNTNIKDGNFHVLTLVKNKHTDNLYAMYIDGVEVTGSTYNTLGLQTDAKDGLIGIGRYDNLSYTGTYSAPGEYYSFTVYNRVLTDEEIQTNYYNYLSRYILSNE